MERQLEANVLELGSKPALILVDMISGFTDPACPLGTDCQSVVASNQRLLQAFRKNGLPIIFTTVLYENIDQARVFRRKVPALNWLKPGTRWVEIDPLLEPLPGETVITKRWASAFFGTSLALHLREQAVDSLVVTGLTTSGCVRATVVDGLQHDFPVLVPREAVGDRSSSAHKANLFDINAKYGSVVSEADIISKLGAESLQIK